MAFESQVNHLRKLLTDSRNHRIIEVGSDLWRSLGPTPLLKKGYLKLVAQDHVQMSFEYLQGWRLRNLSGQAVQVLSHPHSEKMFPDIQGEPPVFQFVPLPLVLSLGTTKKSLASPSMG